MIVGGGSSSSNSWNWKLPANFSSVWFFFFLFTSFLVFVFIFSLVLTHTHTQKKTTNKRRFTRTFCFFFSRSHCFPFLFDNHSWFNKPMISRCVLVDCRWFCTCFLFYFQRKAVDEKSCSWRRSRHIKNVSRYQWESNDNHIQDLMQVHVNTLPRDRTRESELLKQDGRLWCWGLSSLLQAFVLFSVLVLFLVVCVSSLCLFTLLNLMSSFWVRRQSNGDWGRWKRQ